jgi:hypothetical protein
MDIYELTLRFEAEDDLDALAFGATWERGIEDLPSGGQVQVRKVAVERVTKIVVTRMPLEDGSADPH